jgi:hypothetical protein
MTESPLQADQQSMEAADAAMQMGGPQLLGVEEASQLLARSRGRVAVWMGESGSGKTALTMRLYERQRIAPDDVQFAGSATLLAFEELARRRRIGAAEPSPDAAPFGSNRGDERQIFHLALRHGDEGVNLLIADLPGRLFRALADNQLALDAVPLVRRADKLALIVDGARLRDPATRSSVLTGVRQLLERISHTLPESGSDLALVVTKWDLIAEDPDTLAYWQGREHQVADDVRELQASAPHIRVAAAAPASFPQDDGVGALRSWLLDAPGTPTIDPPVEPYERPVDAPEPVRRSWRRRR